MREAHAEAEVEAGNTGARKTLTCILKNENQADIGKLAPVHIAKCAVICADESDAYDLLHARYEVRRVISSASSACLVIRAVTTWLSAMKNAPVR